MLLSGEDLVSKPALQDEASDGRQDARAGRPTLRPSRSAPALRRRRRPIAAHFRSRDAAAILPSRDDRCLLVVRRVAGVSRAEQHGTAGARTAVTRAHYASLVYWTQYT